MKEFDFDFRDIVEFAKDVILVTKAQQIDDPGPEIVYVNNAFTELTGYTAEEVIGKTPRILQSHGTDEETKRKIRQALEQRKPVRVTIKNYSKTGKEYWLDLSILPLKDSQDNVTHFVAIERDVTVQKDIEQTLEILSKTDSLTGILNRRALYEILEREFSRFKRCAKTYSVLMLDIDHFKKINDRYGHATGDVAIQHMAKTCQSVLRRHDRIARIGGEEFCVLLPQTTYGEATEVAEKLKETASITPVETPIGDILMTISIGVSEVSETDIEHTAALRRADNKMYAAKNSGRNRVCS